MSRLMSPEKPAAGNVLADLRNLDTSAVKSLLPGILGADATARISDEALDGILRVLRVELAGQNALQRDLTDVMSGVIDKLGLSGTLRQKQADQINALLDIVEGVRVEGVTQTMGNIKQAVQQGKIRGLFEKPIVNDRDKVGRNDKCSCGSGKKYKNCCMEHR